MEFNLNSLAEPNDHDQIMEEDANKAHHELDQWTKETRKLKLKKFGSDALDLREKT